MTNAMNSISPPANFRVKAAVLSRFVLAFSEMEILNYAIE